GVTALALDDDLRRRWFQLEAELKPGTGTSGLFFGWQEWTPGVARAYLVFLEGDVNKRQLVFGPVEVSLKEATRLVPPAQDKFQTVPLPALGNPARLHVEATPGKIRIRMDGKALIETAPEFDPRGTLGIWVQDGAAYFGNIRVTATRAD